MNARPVVAVVLLLTFPASTLAQTSAAARLASSEASVEPTPRLDLKLMKFAGDEAERKPFSLPFNVRPLFEQNPPATPCVESEARGRTDADAKPMHKGWFWGSVALGAGLGVFGVGAAPATAAMVKPKPKVIPQGVDAACYTQGFSSKGRHEHALTALWGGLVGMGIWLVSYGVAQAFD